jgi:hypothetical protein
MKLTIPIAAAVLSLAFCVPVASADPDGYQPQLRESATDVVDRYLRSHAQDVRHEQAGGVAARHPDSLGVRRGGPASTPVAASGTEPFAWQVFGSGIAGGVALALLALAAVQVGRERRRLAHR